MPEISFRHEPDHHRYVICADGEPAGLAEYREHPGQLVIRHAEIDDAHGGQGLGSQLVVHVLQTAREQGVEVVPLCPFVRGYIARHPEWLPLVPEARRGALGL